MIRVVDLYKSFGGQQVLKGISLELETGKITTIIGGSGSGKTVLLKHLNALLLPDRGSILVDGQDITKMLPRSGSKRDRKSTRLNSSHVRISYAVFCLKKKKNAT